MNQNQLEGIVSAVAAKLLREGPATRATVVSMLRERGLTHAEALQVIAQALECGALELSHGSLLRVASKPRAAKPCKQAVLVVDDDPEIRTAVRDVLEDDGYHVVAASNGKEALRLLPKMDRPCVILLDLMMPVMNGWDLLEILKEDELLMDIPVTLVSAAADHIPAGTHLLKKPIDLGALLETVHQACA
jgi:CheY-like chemotaxis protein